MNLSRLRKLKYALPLAALVMALHGHRVRPRSPPPSAAGTPIKIAILSDCKGAFAAFYGADVGGAIMAFTELTGAKVVNKNDPLKGMTGGASAVIPSRSSASAARTTPPTSRSARPSG